MTRLPRTPSQTVGPFYSIGLCRDRIDELVPPSDPRALLLHGRLLDGEGQPIDGMVEAWDHVDRRWGRSATDGDGVYRLTVAKPAGSGGDAPRLDVYVFGRGLLEHRLTRVYFPDEAEANAADPVLSALPKEDRGVLVAEPDDGGLRFDIRMQGERATVFFAV